jgi:hypothetical protein
MKSGMASKPAKIKPAKNRGLFDEEGPEQDTLFARSGRIGAQRWARAAMGANPEHYLAAYLRRQGRIESSKFPALHSCLGQSFTSISRCTTRWRSRYSARFMRGETAKTASAPKEHYAEDSRVRVRVVMKVGPRGNSSIRTI